MYKQLLIAVIWLTTGTITFGQTCFNRYFLAGQEEARKQTPNHELVIELYKVALQCSEANAAQKAKAQRALDQAHENRINEVRKLLDIADKAGKAAQKAQDSLVVLLEQVQASEQNLDKEKKRLERITKASRLATGASKELESGQLKEGLDLAFWAYHSIIDDLQLNVKRSFGDAVLQNYRENLGETPGLSRRAAFSQNGQFAMTLAGRDTVKIWENGRRLPVAALIVRGELISAMAFSPDGQSLLTGSTDSIARIWNYEGQTTAELKGHTDEVSGVAYSPDGVQILTWSRDGTARLWDNKGRPTATLVKHQAPILSAAFSKDGTSILTRGADHLVAIWDRSGTLQSQQGLLHQGYVYAARFSPDGQSALSCSAGGGSGLWSLDGRQIATFSDHKGWVTAVDFSSDGQYIITAGSEGFLRIRNAQGETILSVKAHNQSIAGVGFSPDGQMIFTFSQDDRIIKLWDVQGKPLGALYGHLNDIISVEFLPDNLGLLSASLDGSARLWDLKGDLIFNYQGAADQLVTAKYAPRSKRILIVSQKEAPVFCPHPQAVYEILQENPPNLSEEMRERYGVDEREIGDGGAKDK